ncbi:MAG: class I SAM-dependent methyltransferase [Candidatus Schekmanbacteria bacterium]|nr:class I SAM-dependent methyltransferase [Candidatus Schekmanbacteria bacterium]
MVLAARFVPALRFHFLTRFFDPLLRLALDERGFKERLIQQAALAPGHRLMDLGCGTGTLLVMIARQIPGVSLVGLDPDAAVLGIARRKLAAAGVAAGLVQAFPWESPFPAASFDRIVSSLVLHHLLPGDKERTLAAAFELLVPGGELHVLDLGKAHNLAMRLASLAPRLADGLSATAQNVHGELPRLIAAAGFPGVREEHHAATVFGTVAWYRGVKPAATR